MGSEIRSANDAFRIATTVGVVKITFPSGMTADSVDGLEQFFQLFIKKAKRRAGGEPKRVIQKI